MGGSPTPPTGKNLSWSYICEKSQHTKFQPPTLLRNGMMHDAWCMMHDAWCMMHNAWCMMYDARCNTLVHLIFVRTVNIPNLSLLPMLEVAYDAWCMMHDAWCNTLVDLIFVRTVSIPNISLLPCFEVA